MPSLSASSPSRRCAVVDKVVDKNGTRKVAEAYLEYLYTAEGQEIAGKQLLPAADPKAAAEVRRRSSRSSTLFTIDEAFGGWHKAQKTHFADGGDLRPDLRP